MEIDVAETAPRDVEADVLGFAIAEPAELPPARGRARRPASSGRLSHLLEDGELTGGRGRRHARAHGRGARGPPAGRGRGRASGRARRGRAPHGRRRRRGANGRARREDRRLAARADEGLPPAEQARAVVDGIVLGRYDAGRWKTNGSARGDGRAARPLRPRRSRPSRTRRGEAGDRRRLGEPLPRPRERPAERADARAPRRVRARRSRPARERSTVEILGPAEIDAAGMGAFAAVAQGSDNEPRLIRPRLRARGAGPSTDSSSASSARRSRSTRAGISMKPADGMDEMKSDMGGGAAVLAAVGAIAELGLPVARSSRSSRPARTCRAGTPTGRATSSPR